MIRLQIVINEEADRYRSGDGAAVEAPKIRMVVQPAAEGDHQPLRAHGIGVGQEPAEEFARHGQPGKAGRVDCR